MHHEPTIIEERLRRVRREYIDRQMWGPRHQLDALMWSVPDEADGTVGEPVAVEVALAADDWKPAGPGTPWGRPWGTAWFRLQGAVPDAWIGEHVDAILNVGFNDIAPGFMAEGMIWREGRDGWAPERGLHPANHIVVVDRSVAGGERVDYLIEASANPIMWGLESAPNSDRDTAGSSPIYFVTAIDLAVRNVEVVGLHHDLRALMGVRSQVPADSARAWEILAAVDRSLDALDLHDVVGTAAAAREELRDVLSRPASASAHRLSAVGHAHLDTAWLWPLRETVRKAARTFSNALRTAEDEPEFAFACSQAAQYDWMRQRYPKVFADIGDAIERGQWIPVGGSWVEADGNVTGGESMARQFLHGQGFFREHFDVTCTEVWIPDVFGYPASFPQLFRLAGCERFLTQKMSWNRTNRFPHHTFWWEGIDGSRVFTHFPPVDTYCAQIEPFELAKAEHQFAEKGQATRSMLLFGHGDGGGGPAPDMLERYRRLRDLEGVPTIEIESPERFFDQAMAEYADDAPVWVGELYLEMHRGTYTSQARTKTGNRRCERLLREAELWSTMAYGGRAEDGYPAEALDRIWKEVLVLQFHDILPGSSIGWVHREAESAHERMSAELESIIDAALTRLAARPSLANPAPHDRDEVVVLSGVPLSAGEHLQQLADGSVALRVAMPAMGLAALEPLPIGRPVTVESSPTGHVLDNGLVRVAIGTDGCVHSYVVSDTGRDVIAPGDRGGLPQIHPDLPLEYDAWDIEAYDRRTVRDIDEVSDMSVTDDGPLVARVRVHRTFDDSSLTQTYELRAGSPRLDIHLDIDWHERDRLLKLAFPVDVYANDVNRHIQYGHVRTPIHTNTSWDAARFELCAHHWIDVGEPGFGVALLNDGRYGHDVTRTMSDGPHPAPTTTMRLTLLKGARFPDPRADLGRHRVTCALLPHTGRFRKEGVIVDGYRMNHPVRAVIDGAASTTAEPLVSVDTPSVIVEAVKAAEDGSGDLVVRCYESHGGRADAVLRFDRPVNAVRLTDFLEDDPPPAPEPRLDAVDEHSFRLSLRPFQIATMRVTPT
jgi:alpha-mannosidase